MTQGNLTVDRECFSGAKLGPWHSVAAFPLPVRAYLAHTEGGMAIRAIARLSGGPPSTILRHVRSIEARRDDRLVDAALSAISASLPSNVSDADALEGWEDMICKKKLGTESFDEKVAREARRILRRLCEKDAFLAIAEDMERAVVLRETVAGKHTRTAVVDREVAQHFALQDWITGRRSGRVARYEITEAGRATLKRLLEEERQARNPKLAAVETTSPFGAQHQIIDERVVAGDDGARQRVRYNLAESPLTVLGRKRDKTGQPYLTPDLIDAGERLREDFELAQMGPRVTQNWASFLTPQDRGSAGPARGPAAGPQAARDRVSAALEDLGPGLGDVVFRVCCFLEGLETAERRLGWSARSGKVVLRIALQRLSAHYNAAGPRAAVG